MILFPWEGCFVSGGDNVVDSLEHGQGTRVSSSI